MVVSLSVVIPAHNEAGNIEPLLSEINTTLSFLSRSIINDYEIIVVDDGSDDSSRDELYRALSDHPKLRVLCHMMQCGKTAGLVTGITAAEGVWIVTMDGDGQDVPSEIPKLLAARDASVDPMLRLVSAVRQNRNDGKAKGVASKIANRFRQFLLKDGARDSGCGFKLIKREAFLALPVFDNMHRFLPALIKRSGYTLIEVPVVNRPRLKGKSHYGIIDRGLVGIVDLFGVAWLMRRYRRPVVANLSDMKVKK